MKVVGNIRIINQRNAAFAIDEAFVTALGIREGTILHGISLGHTDAREGQLTQGGGVEDRLMTLIVTPFPRTSWSRLIRMSVTLDPRPGSLFELIQALNALKLLPRYVEDVTGTTLSHPVPSTRSDDDHSILPSATFVLELPDPPSLSAELHDLHILLLNIIDDPRTSAEAIPTLQSRLNGLCERRISIQWISPMSTLNRLSKKNLEVEKLRVSRSEEKKFQVSLLPWRRALWNDDSVLPHVEHSMEGKVKLLAMTSLDSDEKIIAWYFYQYNSRLVVQFEVTTPAFGLEHLWWEYIFGCVKEAGGSVLGSASSSRINGSWGTLRCTAMFPLESSPGESEDESVKKIVHCFRKLQGDRSSTGEFDSFTKRLADEREVVGSHIIPDLEDRKRWSDRNFTTLSQLDRLVVWDPRADSVTPRYANLFAPNPFSFTLPLRLSTYGELYGDLDDADTKRTRRRLASAIIEKLSHRPGENIAIVGAHRAGKTTVLNLVYDLLIKRLETQETPILIPIHISASFTPPHMLFISILEEMHKLPQDKLSATLKRYLSKISNFALAVLSGTKTKAGPLEFDFGHTREVLSGSSQIDFYNASDSLRSLLTRVEEERKEALPELLRVSLRSLRDALDELQPYRSKESGSRLVVLMDEFSDSSMWGDPRTLAVWRHAIESDEFSRIKWLFSTTRPVKDVTEYSPITNILLEVNVGSLRPEESERMIDAFAVTAWKNEAKQTLPTGEKLRPIITHPARNFLINVTSSLPYLLQVSCYHIYDRATRSNFPLINKELSRRTILTKVLPEMADYLERQWSQIPENAKRFIIESLRFITEVPRKEVSLPEQFLENFHLWEVDLDRMPPGSLKALDRSGLRGEDGRCVAPLVAAWLLSRDMQ